MMTFFCVGSAFRFIFRFTSLLCKVYINTFESFEMWLLKSVSGMATYMIVVYTQSSKHAILPGPI